MWAPTANGHVPLQGRLIMKWKFGLLALALPMFVVTSGGEAQACVARGSPKVALKLERNGVGKALIHEYSCRDMVRKTFCVMGIRLSDVAADDKIVIRSVRVVHLKDGSAVEGFAPTPNPRTTAAWGRVMDGAWFGFAAVYRANADAGIGIEADFTYDPSMSPQDVLKAFERGHVGLAEGEPNGGIGRGHMLEVVQIRGATLAQ
jgi:hypothetical protein